MRKNHFLKAIALLVCLAFVAIAVPGLNSSEKRTIRVDTKTFLTKPGSFFSTLIPALGSIFQSNASIEKASPTNSKSKVKPLGEITLPIPPK